MTDIKKIDDGGFAFPCGPDNKSGWSAEYGMSLRDWFAGQALPSACTLAFNNIGQATTMQLLPEEWAAKIAYGVADAMLAAGKGGAA